MLANAKFDRSTVKHGTQNIQNDCHQWLSDSFRVHQIRFRPGLRPDPNGGAYSAPTDPLAGLRGPTSKGDKMGGKEERHRRMGEEGAEGLTPFCKFMDPPVGTKNVCILTTGGAHHLVCLYAVVLHKSLNRKSPSSRTRWTAADWLFKPTLAK